MFKFLTSIQPLLIYSPKISSRLKYITDVLFKNVSGIDCRVEDDIELFKQYTGPKLNYSDVAIEHSIQIIPHTILFDYGVKDYLIEIHSNDVYEKYFFKNNKGNLPFDLLGASFWLISRYEEYLPFKANKYNMFDYRSSLAWQNNFIEKPLVNIWLLELQKLIKKQFPQVEFKKQTFQYVPTIDIDNVYKYKHKGFVRTLAGFINSILKGNFPEIKNRINTVFFSKQDEYDCYHYLIEINKKYKKSAIYFFLLGDYGINDKNHSASNLKFQQLIKHLADYAQTGIHPSFASNFKQQQLKIEIVRLSNITHKEVINSRQHYGMLQFPNTYQSLIGGGILNDYSLGYSQVIGYRASICSSYKWYVIGEETVTNLTLNPYCINDVALKKASKNNEDLMKEIVTKHIKWYKDFGGKLISVFHNDILGNTTEGLIWRRFYEHCLEASKDEGSCNGLNASQ